MVLLLFFAKSFTVVVAIAIDFATAVANADVKAMARRVCGHEMLSERSGFQLNRYS